MMGRMWDDGDGCLPDISNTTRIARSTTDRLLFGETSTFDDGQKSAIGSTPRFGGKKSAIEIDLNRLIKLAERNRQ